MPDLKQKILRWLAAKKYRHVERFCTGRCNTWVTPESMLVLVEEGLAETKRPLFQRPGYVSVPCQFYITEKGSREIET